jgi:hypothetical protein
MDLTEECIDELDAYVGKKIIRMMLGHLCSEHRDEVSCELLPESDKLLSEHYRRVKEKCLTK